MQPGATQTVGMTQPPKEENFNPTQTTAATTQNKTVIRVNK